MERTKKQLLEMALALPLGVHPVAVTPAESRKLKAVCFEYSEAYRKAHPTAQMPLFVFLGQDGGVEVKRNEGADFAYTVAERQRRDGLRPLIEAGGFIAHEAAPIQVVRSLCVRMGGGYSVRKCEGGCIVSPKVGVTWHEAIANYRAPIIVLPAEVPLARQAVYRWNKRNEPKMRVRKNTLTGQTHIVKGI